MGIITHMGDPRTRPVRNPWGLTQLQAAAMDAVAKTGCHKAAARQLGVEPSTIQSRIEQSRLKIGTPGRLLHMLEWDRWRQGEGRGVPA